MVCLLSANCLCQLWCLSFISFRIDDYIWSGETFEGMYDPGHSVDGASFGIGAAPNCFFPLLNVRDSHDMQRDYAGNPRTSPSIGAFSPWHDRTSHATQDIAAGAELFVDYGYSYFGGSRIDTFGLIPFLPDFHKADVILEKFSSTMKNLSSTFWKSCLVSAQTAQVRNTSCHMSTIEETEEFRTISSDIFTLSKSILGIWPTRTLAALPDQPSNITGLQAKGGTSMKDYDRSIKNISYLQEHGTCMDYLVAKPSTISVAGRGAFAKQTLSAGSTIAPVPLIHLPERRVMDIYPGAGLYNQGRDDRSTPIHQQLLLNYCFGHPESTILLCPYGVVSSLVNHAPSTNNNNTDTSRSTANAKIVWSLKTSAHLEWMKQPVEKWAYSSQAGLGFDYVALRDIAAGEEIFIDYGDDWQAAWNRHINNWKPVVRLVDALNQNIDSLIPTEQEWKWSMGDPNVNDQAVNLWCYNIYREMQGLLEGRKESYPCKIVLRHGDDPKNAVYTAELVIRMQLEESDDEMCEELFDEVLWMLPRDAFAFGGAYERHDTREYSTPGTFRHDLRIPDDIMPEIWKNSPTSESTTEVTVAPIVSIGTQSGNQNLH